MRKLSISAWNTWFISHFSQITDRICFLTAACDNAGPISQKTAESISGYIEKLAAPLLLHFTNRWHCGQWYRMNEPLWWQKNWECFGGLGGEWGQQEKISQPTSKCPTHKYFFVVLYIYSYFNFYFYFLQTLLHQRLLGKLFHPFSLLLNEKAGLAQR